MAKFDNKTVEAFASRCVDEHINNKVSLEDAVAKYAQAEGWSAEQILRVARKANVGTFEKKFAQMANGSDRIVDFDTVDGDAVVARLHAAVTKGTKTAAVYPDIEDEMAPTQPSLVTAKVPSDFNVKTAMLQEVPEYSDVEKLMHLQDVVGALKTKVAGLQWRWEGMLESLSDQSKQLYWDHERFEKNAMALYGQDVIPELNILRQLRQDDAPELTKEAANAALSNSFGVESPAVQTVMKAAQIRAEYAKHVTALATAETMLLEATGRKQ